MTGGAGYIGAHVCKALQGAGYLPVTYDNLSTGHRSFVRWGPLVEGDIRNAERLADAIRTHKIEALIHCAASAYISESVSNPQKYYENNVGGSLAVLKAMLDQSCDQIVFSSTCSIYGQPAELPGEWTEEGGQLTPSLKLRRNVVENEEWTKLFAETDITMHTSDSLEGGLLAGKLKPERETGSDNGGIRPRFIERFAEYKAIADRFGATPSQLSLAFCLTHPATTSILIGASSLDQVRENIGAIALAKQRGAAIGEAVAPFSFADHHTDKAYGGRFAPGDLGGFLGTYKRPG